MRYAKKGEKDMAEYNVTVTEGDGCLEQIEAGCALVGCIGCAAILFGGLGTGAAAGVGLFAAIKKLITRKKNG